MTRKNKNSCRRNGRNLKELVDQCAWSAHAEQTRMTACNMAETAGFEPAAGFFYPGHLLSRKAPYSQLGHVSIKTDVALCPPPCRRLVPTCIFCYLAVSKLKSAFSHMASRNPQKKLERVKGIEPS